MTDRPEWIACIADTRADLKTKMLCGRWVEGFSFLDIDHAANEGRRKGRLVPCPECRDVAIAALMVGADEVKALPCWWSSVAMPPPSWDDPTAEVDPREPPK